MAAVLALAFRFALAFFLLPAGINKVFRLREFAAAVEGYRVVPARAVRVVVFVVPCAEILLGLLLALDIAPVPTASVAAALWVLFIGVMAAALRTGRHVACGCYGFGETREVSVAGIVRNVALLTLSVCVAVLSVESSSDAATNLQPRLGLPLGIQGGAVAVVPLGILWSISVTYLLEWAVETAVLARATLKLLRGATQ